MQQAPITRSRAARLAFRIIPIALTAAAGVGLSIAAFHYTQSGERQRLESEFNQLAAGRIAAVRKEIDVHLGVLESTKSLYATDNVGRTKFRNFTRGVLGQHKSIEAISWIPRIPLAGREVFERDAEKDGLPAFWTSELRDGHLFKAGIRPHYFPIYYMEVNGGYDVILGLDAGSNLPWAKAIADARDKGQTVAAPAFQSGEETRAIEVIVFHPIYRIGLPRETIAQRRENLLGLTAAIFRIGNVVETALKPFQAEGVEIEMVDVTDNAGKRTLYRPSPGADSNVPSLTQAYSPLRHETRFDVAGRQWAVVAGVSPVFFQGRETNLPWITLGVGLSFTALLVIYFMTLVTRTARVEKLVAERTAQLSQAYEDLKESEAQLIQAEKMASLGQMIAGVAHEINTPLGYVRSTVQLVGERMGATEALIKECDQLINLVKMPNPDDSALDKQFQAVADRIEGVRGNGTLEETTQLLRDGLYGLDRIAEIVVNLKDFARLDRAKLAEFDVNKGIEQTLVIAHNLLKGKARVMKQLGEIPKISCAPSQINQVLLNIVKNAAEAIDGTGMVAIKTWAEDGVLKIAVQDNGAGIPKDVLPKIFDPFFTTKKIGEGTGLGLSVCYKIIEQHGGGIKVASQVGKGTRFIISLPVSSPAAMMKSA